MTLIVTVETPCTRDSEDRWFSDEAVDIAYAKDACLDCPVFFDCREEGKQWEYGVWGGTDREERGFVDGVELELDDTDKKLLALARAGLAREEIEAELDVSTSTVMKRVRRMREAGMDLPETATRVGKARPVGRPSKVPADVVELAVKMRGEGARFKEIAARAGVSESTIRYQIGKYQAA